MGEESTCIARDAGRCRIDPWGRSPGEGYSNPLQCSCLENPMDRGALKGTDRDEKAQGGGQAGMDVLSEVRIPSAGLYCTEQLREHTVH